MKSPIIIKGNKMGIRLIIDEQADMEDITAHLRESLIKTHNYYSNVKPIYVAFEGKILAKDEKDKLIEILRGYGLNVKSKEDEDKKKLMTPKITNDEDGLFYVGNLRNGQTIEAAESIVIIGNVEQGASVRSEGNIIVIGSLSGSAKAGIKGNKNAFVYSF